MYNIDFFNKSYPTKNKIVSGYCSIQDVEEIEIEFEKLRAEFPHIYNIETTNYCNMKCVMCPRTMFMTRKNIWIEDELFDQLTDQVITNKEKDLNEFWQWLEKEYGQDPNEISENGFYFSIVSKSLILHGFGEPFLDKKLIKRLEICNKKNIPTYFSCTPATMTIEKAKSAMIAGLGVLKFSLDAMDERKIQKIRGKRANFKESVDKILELLEFKEKNNLKTLLVPCMIDMAEKIEDLEMHNEFINFWKDKKVFAYIKSQDNRWITDKENNLKQNKSHYSKQYCEYPWISCSVMAEGNVVPCTQISNNELVMGNVKENTLGDIWNGKNYQDLRKMHLTGKFPKNHKCNARCDMKKIYQYLK